MMWLVRTAGIACGIFVSALVAQGAEFETRQLQFKSEVAEVMRFGPRAPDSFRTKLKNSATYKVSRCGTKLCAKRSKNFASITARRKNALPDAVISRGTRDIRRAWLSDPVRRYDHGVLGDNIEAGSLSVETADGAQLSFKLPKNEVFEDRYARIADLDGDRRDEVVVVNSHVDLGAALAVFGLRGGKLVRLARTPFIGRSHRWLNPAGIGDFDNDMSNGNEVAIVVTPHIGGTLQFWSYADRTLSLNASRYGFSNHAIGSRIQKMSVVLPAKFGARLVLPDASRRTLVEVTLRAGKVEITRSLQLPGQIATEIVRLDGSDGNMRLGFGVTGRVFVVAE